MGEMAEVYPLMLAAVAVLLVLVESETPVQTEAPVLVVMGVKATAPLEAQEELAAQQAQQGLEIQEPNMMLPTGQVGAVAGARPGRPVMAEITVVVAAVLLLVARLVLARTD